MKKIFLILLLAFSNFVSFGADPFGIDTRDGCLRYNSTTGSLKLVINWGSTDWTSWVQHYGPPTSSTWIFIVDPSSSGYPRSFFGPIPPSLIDPTTMTCEYDISTYLGLLANGNCINYLAVSDASVKLCVGSIIPTLVNPDIPSTWIAPEPCNTLGHSYAVGSKSGGAIALPWTACLCPESDPLPDFTCDADFTFKLSIDSKGIAPMIGNIYPKTFHPSSSYVYNYGGGYTSPAPISKVYAPGIYTVCLKETTIDGQICEKCVNICVPDPTAVLSTYTSSGGGISGTPTTNPDTVVCNPEFTFVYTTNSAGTPPNNGTIFLDDFHATSTYSYDWGDGHVTPHPISKIYSPGNYTVCVTETRPNGAFCKKCIQICVTDPTPSIFTPFRESNDNTITGSGMMENKISISPNPTYSNATINLELVQKDNVHVMVIDMTGKKVSEIFNGSLAEGAQKLHINTDNFASGLYQVQVMIGNKMSTHKLSVIK